ncbi:MAG: RidA family protein [Gemmataceae bacterium]
MRNGMDRRRWLRNCGWVAIGATGGWLAPAAWDGWRQWGQAAAADADSPEERIKQLNLSLPPSQPSRNPLAPAVRVGAMLYVSGHGPTGADGKSVVGKLGQDLDVKQGREAARLVGLRILSVVRAELGSLNQVVRLVKALGMVNCTPDFTQQPQVINGFSDLMVEVFGEQAGKGTRSAVGMSSLPGGIAVEIEALFQVRT